MGKSKTIVIIFHEGHSKQYSHVYLVERMRRRWEADGHKVIEVCGTGERIDADLAFLHVDLSLVPNEYIEYANQFPACINAGISDIRKTTFSKNRVKPGDGYTGSVIVKTAQNHAGGPERYLLGRNEETKSKIPHYRIKIQENSDYKIYQMRSDVPDEIFDDPNLIVERFVPEMHNGRYCIREWIFCGDVSINNVELSDHPIISWGETAPDLAQPPSEELLQIRKELGIDYGKLDYVIKDGRTVLFDINKTTGAGTKEDATPELLKTFIDYGWQLGAGVYRFFPK